VKIHKLLSLFLGVCLSANAGEPIPMISQDRLARAYAQLIDARLTIDGKPIQPLEEIEHVALAINPDALQKQCLEATRQIRMGVTQAPKDKLPEAYAYLGNAENRILNNREKDHGDLVAYAKNMLRKKDDTMMRVIDERCRAIETALSRTQR
jgi:hypothetical protein